MKNSKGNGSRVKVERHKGHKKDKGPLIQAILNIPRERK